MQIEEIIKNNDLFDEGTFNILYKSIPFDRNMFENGDLDLTTIPGIPRDI